SGKRYGHWTGSDVPGRLPAPSWRVRLEKLAPPVPRKELAEYVARFSRGAKQQAAQISQSSVDRAVQLREENAGQETAQGSCRHSSSGLSELKAGIEPAQPQDSDLYRNQNLDLGREKNPQRRLPLPQPSLERTAERTAKAHFIEPAQGDSFTGDVRGTAERAFAQAARSLDPWASRTSPAAGNRATARPFVGGSSAANQGRSSPAPPAWWQSRQDAKALQLARDLNVGRGPELPPLRAPGDAPTKKSGDGARDAAPTRAKGAANGR
ncbi:MAG: hypothetical protein WBF06_00320, partial [Candidatus Acidiferrales bacterium]